MNNLKISTSELAKICGVSQGTVDRALNNRADIKPETKEKILNTAKQYGYRKYVTSEHSEIHGQIGLIVFDLNNEYFSKLITEVEKVFGSLGYGIVVMMTHYDKRREIECIRSLYNMNVDGIILCSINSGTEFDNYLKLFDIPIVSVANKVPSLPYVGIDDYTAMKDVAELLEKTPTENIIYFSPALNYPNAYAQTERYNGFVNGMGKREFSTVTNIDDIKERYNTQTIIVCSSDYYAFQVYFKCKNVKVIGFDNADAIKKYNINIDSVGYSMTEIALGTAEILTLKKSENIIVKHWIEYSNS